MKRDKCQLYCWPRLSEGNLSIENRSLRWRVKLVLKRILSHTTKRNLKKRYARFWNRMRILIGQTPPVVPASKPTAALGLKAGDMVRVRSWEEVEATLDVWGELRGCKFMQEMKPYCGTTRRVFKPVRQFLDERDYRRKKCSGIVLLENAICEGIADYGPCDRACFFFWREEWLERIDQPPSPDAETHL